MLTLAKPLAGGLPMGAVLMTEAIASAIKSGDHGTTFGGGPFVASVALHVLERLSRSGAARARARDRRVVRPASSDEIAHRTSRIRAGARHGLHVGHRRDGHGGARRERGARERAARLLTAGEYTVRLLPPLVATQGRARARAADPRRGPLMAPDVFVRRARPQDAVAISRLNNSFANEGLMLLRTPEMISLAIDDYVVVQGPSGEILACGALKEYSPSVAEIAAIAVSRDAHGQGLGKRDRARGRGAGAQARHLRRLRAHAAAGVLRGHRLPACRSRALSGEDPARLPRLRAALRVQRDLLRAQPADRGRGRRAA